MTLTDLLNNDEVTSSAPVSNTETTSNFISNAEIDKLASLIESFAEKYEETLEEINSVLDKTALLGFGPKTPTAPVAPDPTDFVNMSSAEQKAARKALEESKRIAQEAHRLEDLSKNVERLKAGRRSPAWAIPAAISALGAGYLVHSYDKQKQIQEMGGA